MVNYPLSFVKFVILIIHACTPKSCVSARVSALRGWSISLKEH